MVDKIEVSTTDDKPTLEQEAAAQAAASQAAQGKPPVLEGEQEAPERPDWLPEKFATVEDMAKAYGELEKGQSKAADGDDADLDPGKTAAKAVSDAGLDMKALSAEYADKGELTPESLEALGKQGITPEMVQSYIKGQTAEGEAARATLLEPVGGEQAYTDMITWAADGLPDADIDAFNAVLDGGDQNAIKMAVENLNAKYIAENGKEPSVTLNGKPSATGVSAYESTADLMKDMGNPEYAKNPAFRAKVEAKLARSNIM
jgi:hypothetical protein